MSFCPVGPCSKGLVVSSSSLRRRRAQTQNGLPPTLRGWVLLILAGILACTAAACDGGAAKRSEVAATVYLIELKTGSESTFQRSAGLFQADKPGEAKQLLKVRLDGLEEQVTKYITTDPELIQSDRDRIARAVREEQRQIRDLLEKMAEAAPR